MFEIGQMIMDILQIRLFLYRQMVKVVYLELPLQLTMFFYILQKLGRHMVRIKARKMLSISTIGME